jgi:hypothetical protein
MDKKVFKPTGRNVKKIALIGVGSLLVVGLIGYGTITLLRQLKAPTLSSNDQTQTQTPPAPAAPALTPEKALEAADKSYATAVEKVAAGDQKAALVDYKAAYDNYAIAKNSDRAADAKFAIESIQRVIDMPQNPIKPNTGKASAKE